MRRAIVLFVPEPIATLVDELRRRWDPAMSARIDAHLTLVHEVTDHDAATRRVDEVAALTAPLAVTLTTTRCWSRASYGVYLDVDDRGGAVVALHGQLADLEAPAWARVAYRPHVTLVHGRTVDPALADQAWASLCDRRMDWLVELPAIDVIELDEATGWSSVQRTPFASGG